MCRRRRMAVMGTHSPPPFFPWLAAAAPPPAPGGQPDRHLRGLLRVVPVGSRRQHPPRQAHRPPPPRGAPVLSHSCGFFARPRTPPGGGEEVPARQLAGGEPSAFPPAPRSSPVDLHSMRGLRWTTPPPSEVFKKVLSPVPRAFRFEPLPIERPTWATGGPSFATLGGGRLMGQEAQLICLCASYSSSGRLLGPRFGGPERWAVVRAWL